MNNSGLSIFRDKLFNEVNPTKKKFPKCPAYYREKTDWKVGDLVAYRVIEEPFKIESDDDYINQVFYTKCKLFQKYFLLRVVDIYKKPVSNICPELDFYSEPLVMLYDWYGEEVPSVDLCKRMNFRPIFHSIGKNYYNELGDIIETPTLSQLVVSGVYLSKEPHNGKVCETIVLENDQTFCDEVPELWSSHPVASTFCPSLFNCKLAETYSDFEYEIEFMNNGEME